jgi:hypothetical protein
MRLRAVFLFVLAFWGTKTAAADSPVRYALIIGNNEGNAPAGQPLERLHHAEREARQLREALVGAGAFPDTEQRVLVLSGKGRAAIMAAAHRLAEQLRADRQRWGNLPTLFAFFFTGHGLESQLLTADDPLTSDDLTKIFRDMGASFTFAMFDACFSGSLDPHEPRAKGLRVLSGFNPFDELPREILNSRGSMWVASSRAGEVSYEDEKLGGVLTHYFIEGLEKAGADEFGVSLDALWEYASRQTQRHTSRLGRPQTPQKMVRELTATGPVYMSYRRTRDATLVFAPEVSGQFLVRYETGELSELVAKPLGIPLRLAIFPGSLWIERVDNGSRERQRVELASNGILTVSAGDNWNVTPLPGRQVMKHKGDIADVVIIHDAPTLTASLDVGARLARVPENGISPPSTWQLGLRFDHGHLGLGLAVGMGWCERSYATWSYQVRSLDGAIMLGPAWNWGRVRLGPAVEGRYSRSQLSYDQGGRRTRGLWGGGVLGQVTIPLWPGWPLYASGQVGLAWQQGESAAEDATSRWSAVPVAGLALAARLN